MGPRGLGGGTWIARGPFIGGRLDAIVVSPSSSSTVLAGSPGGGVWRTINNGASWIQPLSYALGDFSITHMAWDRASANNLFMTTYNGLYATTDLGDHFTALVNSGAFPAPLMPLRVGAGPFHTPDPYGFAQLVLGATRIVLYAAPCQGLYYSYDGVSFTQSFPFSGGSGNPDNCIQSIAADDTTGYVYFSTMGGGAALPARLYRSAGPWTATTPSLSWNLANTGLPNGQSVNSLTQTSVAGGGVTYPNNLAAVVSTSGSGYKVWTTSDGTSWSMTAGQATSANWDARVIAYPGGNDLFIGMPVGWASQNYGATFNLFSTVSDHPDLRAYYFSPAFGLMWGANDGSNAAVSQRNITRWSWSVGAAPAAPTAVPTVGISGWQAYFAEATAAPTVSGRRLFTGSQDDEILCSDDQGASWTTAGTPGGGDALALRYSPAAPGRAFFITDDGNLQYSSNVNAASCAGVTWTNVAVGYGNPEVWTHAQIAASPTNASKVYLAGIANKLWAVTIGAGNVPHTTPAPAISVIVDGAGALVIGTEGSGLYRSIDDGATWSSFGLNAPAPQLVLDLAWSPTGGGAGTYFAATTGGLYRLPPGGAWTLVNGGGGYTVSAVAVDPPSTAAASWCRATAARRGRRSRRGWRSTSRRSPRCRSIRRARATCTPRPTAWARGSTTTASHRAARDRRGSHGAYGAAGVTLPSPSTSSCCAEASATNSPPGGTALSPRRRPRAKVGLATQPDQWTLRPSMLASSTNAGSASTIAQKSPHGLRGLARSDVTAV
ncbi:MAG: hypothetical protein E6J91_35615 [Deltaproteobacteria bacterium]|nr:MAG: hypothetical protein E6J91_35615 [Deltaproteobacteria bacterium]